MSSIEIRPLTTMAEFAMMEEVERAVWNMQPGETHSAGPPLLKAMSKYGGVILGAFDGDRMVGMHLSYPALKPGGEVFVWSHMTGVLKEYQHTGLGEQLKWAQRDETLKLGLSLISWTVDPLEAPNNAVNFGKLGTTCHTYNRNVYGMMSGINAGIESDRFTVDWHLDSERVIQRKTSGRPALTPAQFEAEGAHFANRTVEVTASLRGITNVYPNLSAPRILVEVPGDFQAVKAHSMDLGIDWRMKTRELFETYFARGYEAIEFMGQVEDGQRRNYYLLEQTKKQA